MPLLPSCHRRSSWPRPENLAEAGDTTARPGASRKSPDAPYSGEGSTLLSLVRTSFRLEPPKRPNGGPALLETVPGKTYASCLSCLALPTRAERDLGRSTEGACKSGVCSWSNAVTTAERLGHIGRSLIEEEELREEEQGEG